VGSITGVSVGSSVGEVEGSLVGDALGSSVGEVEGSLVGDVLGLSVGEREGSSVGDGLGSSVVVVVVVSGGLVCPQMGASNSGGFVGAISVPSPQQSSLA